MYLICIYVIGNKKTTDFGTIFNMKFLELFNMKLSNTIDQTLICKKSYDDHLGYFWTGHQKAHWSPRESKIDLRLG
jgi:hypothetical protein